MGTQLPLPGDVRDTRMTALEINILAGEWLPFCKLRFGGQIVSRPIIDRLAADEAIRLSVRIVGAAAGVLRRSPGAGRCVRREEAAAQVVGTCQRLCGQGRIVRAGEANGGRLPGLRHRAGDV